MSSSVNSERTVLVTGATGKQGGAVARELLHRGYRVRALTREPGKPAAQELAGLGADVVRGDLDDPESLRPSLEGVYGAFSMQNYWETGFEREVAQGIALADLASEIGVQHFVYDSVGSANRETGLSHFESKWRIEERIRELDLAGDELSMSDTATTFGRVIGRPVEYVQLSWEKYREIAGEE